MSGSDCIGHPACGYLSLLLVGQVFSLPVKQSDGTVPTCSIGNPTGQSENLPHEGYPSRISTLAL